MILLCFACRDNTLHVFDMSVTPVLQYYMQRNFDHAAIKSQVDLIVNLISLCKLIIGIIIIISFIC